ncbi:fatty acid oxygenase [Alternaria alternata]|nr:fatty acid oxygenase [Alternaria alternata]
MAGDVKRTPLQELVQDTGSQNNPSLQTHHDLRGSLSGTTTSGGLDDSSYDHRLMLARQAQVGCSRRCVRIWNNLWPRHWVINVGSLGCFLYLETNTKPDQYRSADGSNNNIHLPNVGKAGSYYARMVTPRHVPTKLPDPEFPFDTPLAREAKPEPHPSQLSSLFFAFAAVIVCDVFRTGDEDQNMAMPSSYLDLSSLYGETKDSQNMVRTFVDGKLKPDAFADTRILSRPAALAIINENGRFSPPPNIGGIDPGSYKRAVAKRDNDLFQIARLVTTGLYINIVLKDYVRSILNLQCVDSSANLDPRAKIEDILGQTDSDKARGNQTSAEINMIYRWHSTISMTDEAWLIDHMTKICPDMDIDNMTLEGMRAGVRRHAATPPADPSRRVFAGLERNLDGYFRDQDLVKILTEATDEVAMSFGPHRIPQALKVIEIMSIEQGREWGVASLNETRRFFGMTSHTSFTDIHPDPDVAAALEALYGDVENVELCAGAILEQPSVPMTPGSGLCAGTTTTRAVVSHALSLVRGDRFYTVDYTPHHLTAFGFNMASSDYSIAGGGVIYKLLMRVFPEYYRGNSIYAHYPLTTPPEMRRRQKSLGHEMDFDYDKPRYGAPPTVITD